MASSLALDGFRVTLGPAGEGGRPLRARRGRLVIVAEPGAAARAEIITPSRYTIFSRSPILREDERQPWGAVLVSPPVSPTRR